MQATETRHRKNQCGQKVKYPTLEAAQANADQRLQDIIYDKLEPQAYQCAYDRNHYHVGHSLKRLSVYGK